MEAHPGGPFMDADSLRHERAFDVGAAFELIGHSSSADQLLEGMLVPPPPGRSHWPAPPSCVCPATTFAVVSVAGNVRSAGARLLERTLWLWRALLGLVLSLARGGSRLLVLRLRLSGELEAARKG